MVETFIAQTLLMVETFMLKSFLMKSVGMKSPELKLGVENSDKYAPFPSPGNNSRCSFKAFFLRSILPKKERKNCLLLLPWPFKK